MKSEDKLDRFVDRHTGPRPKDIEEMLRRLEIASLDALVERTVPASIRTHANATLPARTERELLDELADLASKNHVFRSYIGMGYHDCVTPPVISSSHSTSPGMCWAVVLTQPCDFPIHKWRCAMRRSSGEVRIM